jgi:protein regulator of cytokinesis 1
VTPERFLKLEKELVRGKAEVVRLWLITACTPSIIVVLQSKRLNQLSATFVQIDWLYTEVGMSPPELDDVHSSPPFKAASSSTASCSYDPFITSTPTPGSRGGGQVLLFKDDTLEYEYLQVFARFVKKMEEVDVESLPENQPIPIGLENVEPTPGLLQWASSLRASLEETKRRREAHIQAMYDQLEGLWRRMGVSDADMDGFVETHKGSTEETIREYEEELERMLELKRERMGAFVESAREEIVKLWDDLMIGEDERADFAPFADGTLRLPQEAY